jgi:hypothetical protein
MLSTNTFCTRRNGRGRVRAALCIEATVVFLHSRALCSDEPVVCVDAMVVFPMNPSRCLETTVVFLNKEILPPNINIVLPKQIVRSVLGNGGSIDSDKGTHRNLASLKLPKAVWTNA